MYPVSPAPNESISIIAISEIETPTAIKMFFALLASMLWIECLSAEKKERCPSFFCFESILLELLLIVISFLVDF